MVDILCYFDVFVFDMFDLAFVETCSWSFCFVVWYVVLVSCVCSIFFVVLLLVLGDGTLMCCFGI